MTMTFSSFGSRAAKAVPAQKQAIDYIKIIELSKNYTTAYNLDRNPKEQLQAGTENFSCVVYKIKEDPRENAIIYEFWKKIPEEYQPFQYFIAVSKSTKDLLWIRDDGNNDLPLSAFKHEDNIVDIVPRYAPKL